MPIDTGDLLVFLAAALALNLTPGNDMMYVLGRGLRDGPKAGVAASFGIATGSLIHLLLVALGVAVVLAEHPQLFDAIRYAGAAYLVWIAVKILMTPVGAPPMRGQSGGLLRAWRDGVLVNLFNPKTIIFMFAFLPPFVHPENGQPLLQLLIFGSLFNIGGTLVNCAVGIFAGRIGEKFTTRRRVARAFSFAASAIFLALAARIAFERR